MAIDRPSARPTTIAVAVAAVVLLPGRAAARLWLRFVRPADGKPAAPAITTVKVGAIFPALALYSKKITSVKSLKAGDTISIPSDPTNQIRALTLLVKAGLITLTGGATGVVGDIVSNPKKLGFHRRPPHRHRAGRPAGGEWNRQAAVPAVGVCRSPHRAARRRRAQAAIVTRDRPSCLHSCSGSIHGGASR